MLQSMGLQRVGHEESVTELTNSQKNIIQMLTFYNNSQNGYSPSSLKQNLLDLGLNFLLDSYVASKKLLNLQKIQ